MACPVIQPIKVTPIRDNQDAGINIISVFLHGIVWNTERCQTIVIDGVLNAKQGQYKQQPKREVELNRCQYVSLTTKGILGVFITANATTLVDYYKSHLP